MVMKAFLDEKKNDLADFKIWFIVDEFNQLNHYLRYLMVQIPFGGLAQERTVNETLYGYNDSLLVTLAQMDPQQVVVSSLSARVEIRRFLTRLG
jgi:hypothetical protein